MPGLRLRGNRKRSYLRRMVRVRQCGVGNGGVLTQCLRHYLGNSSDELVDSDAEIKNQAQRRGDGRDWGNVAGCGRREYQEVFGIQNIDISTAIQSEISAFSHRSCRA